MNSIIIYRLTAHLLRRLSKDTKIERIKREKEKVVIDLGKRMVRKGRYVHKPEPRKLTGREFIQICSKSAISPSNRTRQEKDRRISLLEQLEREETEELLKGTKFDPNRKEK